MKNMEDKKVRYGRTRVKREMKKKIRNNKFSDVLKTIDDLGLDFENDSEDSQQKNKN
ncbi:hypothetical protein IEO70_02250 [Bacillus sp. AGMB 02131]|uniref:Uncharacterized protein n=1 Tax=Peribacillus faecalis TaxID=2772559 RepID=A0A927CXL9_9BACI|nr:hypothetical protein [Peribacillus faecalis]MBD3107189.1 hypothetical protein [Peribacillus faecalis]